jgi:hypothetical protein
MFFDDRIKPESRPIDTPGELLFILKSSTEGGKDIE